MRKFVLPLVALTLIGTGPVFAQRVDQVPTFKRFSEQERTHNQLSESIVAVVNESIISSHDLKARMGLAILSAGLLNSLEIQQKLLPQVIRSLIDEQLQLQEGKKEGLSVSAAEVNKAMERLASDNKIPGGDMAAFLREHGVSPSTLQAQIKAALTWNHVVARKVRPQIDIGDDEVDAVIQRMRTNAGKQEFLISEIFLAVDKPDEEAQVEALAEKLAEQIKGGVAFGAAARQFSQGLGATQGGDMGWIQMGQLAPEIDRALSVMKPGDIAGPIRTASGYHLLGIRDKRTIAVGNIKDMSVKLQQIFYPFAPGVDKGSLMREAGAIRQTTTSCEGLRERIDQDYPQWHWQDLGEVKLDNAPAWLAEKVSPIEEGHASEAMATNKGAMMLFVCERTMPENVDRNAIRAAIGTEKMELMARRLQRDLRKAAYIDIRLKRTP
ncbi:MAG: peptidylprolyl isomerase [Alphaproteobacteria bacterium]|nr:peptidylprolyl isomerase [Alphaproteobacteria bacterium]